VLAGTPPATTTLPGTGGGGESVDRYFALAGALLVAAGVTLTIAGTRRRTR
jgi:hypothetical protein